MELAALYKRVIGFDVHQAQITACALIEECNGLIRGRESRIQYRQQAQQGHKTKFIPNSSAIFSIRSLPLCFSKFSQLAAYAIYPQTHHRSQRVRAFVNFFIKRFKGLPYWDLCLQDVKNT
ncbi:hypothetical protein Nit79A3_2361 [Nitrosomonas sp. Is79A3]|uniref:hypothetical protein n=1 Tax=Nitrosomonas sp. (strain Is79A3) TaxID=261292 RepID=UPI000215C960